MESDRPQTPPRSTYGLSKDAIDKGKSSRDESIQQQSSYVPHLFDLIYAATDSVRASRQHIPPIFLDAEAVDSSLLLGHGASFTASLQRIPEAPPRIKIPGEISPGPRPSHLVYKTARVAFDKTGEPLPEHRRAMLSVITELHALATPELSAHPNIINFLGYAWGSNPFAPQFKLPALMVEYAEHGTLTQLLRQISNLDPSWKHLLCLDAARGLSALHAVDLIHGDVKADNVLICRHPSRKYIAKISDFGFSIISATESTDIWMGGTELWQAPEVKTGPIRLEAAKQTDIYSFGLLAWLVSLNGLNPFSLITEIQTNGATVEELKRAGQLLDIAKEGKWLTKHMRAVYDAKAGQYFEPLATKLSRSNASPDRLRQRLLDQAGFVRDRIVKQSCSMFLQSKLARSLSDLFDASLQAIPAERDLDVMIAVLESDVDDKNEVVASTQAEVVGSETTSTITIVKSQGKASTTSSNSRISSSSSQAYWKGRGYKRHRFSWLEARQFQPSIQNLITNSFLGSQETDSGLGLLMLCAYYMNGYGCQSDEAEALKFLRQSAERVNLIARAFMRRVWSACRPQDNEAGVSYLEDYAKAGSRVALEELRKVTSREKLDAFNTWFHDVAAGVGADWLFPSEMLHGYTQSQWIDDAWLMKRVRTADKPLSQLVVNKRGDTVLHFTAMCGRWRPLKALLLDHKMKIDLQNPLGETPLLAACRAGHGGIVALCLKSFGADASIAASNGETPLHWLHRYRDQVIEPMLEDLLARGAKIEAATKERIDHSRYPSSVDIDIKMPGTPLSWAVHANRPHVVRLLLRRGADPHAFPEGADYSPLDMSAYYHHHECLKVMIEHLESKVTLRNINGHLELRSALKYGPVIFQAQSSADKFSMILRGGADWLNRLHATFDILREKTRFIQNFQSSFKGGSLLYSVVSGARDELVDYMFKHDWLVDTINLPIGEVQYTPVLEAMRWARRPMVQKLIEHGADVGALAPNPFEPKQRNWSALHVFAHEGHDRDLELVEQLVEMGVPVDGTKAAVDDAGKSLPDNINALSLDHSTTTTTTTDPSSQASVESPFTVALRHNAFPLATTLLSLRANPNHLSLSSGFFTSPYPLTPLGHLIIANARYSSARLAYLLNLSNTSFIVEPARKLTALHRCAMGHLGIVRRGQDQDQNHRNRAVVKMEEEEFDRDTNADVMYELLQRWNRKEELDARCGWIDDGGEATALQLAIRAQNPAIVKALVEAGGGNGRA
ncbi:MAG: hypothetical protein Q9212_001579 [Teloschistes hypoglaucus]